MPVKDLVWLACTAAGLCRASQLQCELEEHAMHLHKAQSQLDKAEHKLSEKDTEAAISKAASEAGSREISSLRGELKAHADTTAQVGQLQGLSLGCQLIK